MPIHPEAPALPNDVNPNSDTHPASLRIAETFAQNAQVLSNEIAPAIQGDASVSTTIEGKRCARTPLVLYVQSSTGRIKGVGSLEKIQREQHTTPIQAGLGASVEAVATGLPAGMLEDPDTVRVHAWHEYPGGPPTESEPGVWRIPRPATWARNDHLALSHNYLAEHPLEVLIPDPIERGVFLKSIDNHNSVPESDDWGLFWEQHMHGKNPFQASGS